MRMGGGRRAGAVLADGNNAYSASGLDVRCRASQDSVSVNLPASAGFSYDTNGNLTSDGKRGFSYGDNTHAEGSIPVQGG